MNDLSTGTLGIPESTFDPDAWLNMGTAATTV